MMVVSEQTVTADPVSAKIRAASWANHWDPRSGPTGLVAYSTPIPIVIGSATKFRKLIFRSNCATAAKSHRRPTTSDAKTGSPLRSPNVRKTSATVKSRQRSVSLGPSAMITSSMAANSVEAEAATQRFLPPRPKESGTDG